MASLTVSHEFSGFGDYWGGNGRRWDNNAGCAFAFYGRDTTLRDCVDQWVEDFWNGGDFEHNGDGPNPWEDVIADDVRAAILDSLTEQGRRDYESGAVAECAAYLDDDRECRECGAGIGCDHLDGCREGEVVESDCDDDDDCCESPIWVVLIECVEDDE